MNDYYEQVCDEVYAEIAEKSLERYLGYSSDELLIELAKAEHRAVDSGLHNAPDHLKDTAERVSVHIQALAAQDVQIIRNILAGRSTSLKGRREQIGEQIELAEAQRLRIAQEIEKLLPHLV